MRIGMNKLINNIVKGMATVLVLFPQTEKLNLHLYRPFHSDTQALRSDWLNVGNSMREAIKKINNVER